MIRDTFDGLPVRVIRWYHWPGLLLCGQHLIYISTHVYDVYDREGNKTAAHRERTTVHAYKLRGVLYITKMTTQPMGADV